jgi:drug/metabolite transporter (DMT)-like permease
MSAIAIQAEKKNIVTIMVAFASIYIIWGTTYLAIAMAVETIPAFFMAGVRFLIAGIITFAFLRARGVPTPNRFQWRSAAVVGGLLLMGGNGLVTWSEQQVPSGIAALVVATMPLWMTMFDWLFYKGKRPGRQVVVGLVLGFLGIGLLVGPGQLLGTATFDLTSMLVLLLAPILWSFGSLHSRQANLPDNVFMATAAEMLAGGTLLIVAGLLTGEAGQLDIAAISARSLLATLYLTLFGSIVALPRRRWWLWLSSSWLWYSSILKKRRMLRRPFRPIPHQPLSPVIEC